MGVAVVTVTLKEGVHSSFDFGTELAACHSIHLLCSRRERTCAANRAKGPARNAAKDLTRDLVGNLAGDLVSQGRIVTTERRRRCHNAYNLPHSYSTVQVLPLHQRATITQV